MEENDTILISKTIEGFYTLLDEYPDDIKSFSSFTQFLRNFLRVPFAEQSPPTIEIMTVLKHRKPLLFSVMKKQKNNTLFSIVTQVEMDLETAETRLRKLMK